MASTSKPAASTTAIKKYYFYVLLCADQTLYGGFTDNLQRRLATHNAGKGAKYTASRRPVELVWQKAFTDKHEAMHWEARIKKWPRSKKARLLSPTGRQLEQEMDQTDNKAHT